MCLAPFPFQSNERSPSSRATFRLPPVELAACPSRPEEDLKDFQDPPRFLLADPSPLSDAAQQISFYLWLAKSSQSPHSWQQAGTYFLCFLPNSCYNPVTKDVEEVTYG